jgi:hypothetical protein
MSIAVAAEERLSIARKLACWWRVWRRRRKGMAEIGSLGRDELARMAQDVGVEGAELRVLAGKWPSAADLLGRRTQVVGLDLSRDVDPPVMRDMQRVCSLCASKRRCRHDLARAPSDPVWRRYCPNAGTIDAVMEERPMRLSGRRTRAAV